jgi:hypothetical protein
LEDIPHEPLEELPCAGGPAVEALPYGSPDERRTHSAEEFLGARAYAVPYIAAWVAGSGIDLVELNGEGGVRRTGSLSGRTSIDRRVCCAAVETVGT